MQKIVELTGLGSKKKSEIFLNYLSKPKQKTPNLSELIDIIEHCPR